jgi:hypothetical protein
MNAEELRRHITAQPFRPFSLHVADGRRITVVHHDFIMVSPKGRTADVYQADDTHDILDVLMITGISFDPPPPASSSVDGNSTQIH